MNVEIGAEAAQFPEKEYINGIAFAVQTYCWYLGKNSGWIYIKKSTISKKGIPLK
jgi:hypothetical protein